MPVPLHWSGTAASESFDYPTAREFRAAGRTLDAGGGYDKLLLEFNTHLTDASFVGLEHLEVLVLQGHAAQAVVLGANALAAFSSFSGLALEAPNAAALRVDASAYTGMLNVSAAVVDRFMGGAGTTLLLTHAETMLGHHSLNGGSGQFSIDLTDSAVLADAQFANITNLSQLDMTGGSVAVGARAAAAFNSHIFINANQILDPFFGFPTNEAHAFALDAHAIRAGNIVEANIGVGGSFIAGAGTNLVDFIDGFTQFGLTSTMTFGRAGTSLVQGVFAHGNNGYDIHLDGTLRHDLAQVTAHAVQDHADTVVDLGRGATLTLGHFQVADLGSANLHWFFA